MKSNYTLSNYLRNMTTRSFYLIMSSSRNKQQNVLQYWRSEIVSSAVINETHFPVQ